MILFVAALVTGCGDDDAPGPSAEQTQTDNPYLAGAGYADPVSKTAQAADEAASVGDASREEVFTRLAQIPQGIWLTPEEYPAGEVASYVSSIVDPAAAAGEVPTFVVYGIPDRDCSGGHSAGGLTRGDYGPWVGEIAEAAAAPGGRVVAILEPDALASLTDCGDRDERVKLLADAAHRLADAGVTTYLDAGHSNWIAPSAMAPLLESAGIADVRGFATNVSNFQTDQDERQYGEKLSGLVGGAHYVIDTGRNGFGAAAEWCNPPGRSFGTEPTAETNQGALDAYLWVKPPGESDGTCNGGPPAGQFWPERAMQLAAASGW